MKNILSPVLNSGKIKRLYILGIICVFSSCVTQRQIEYLQQQDPKVKEYVNNNFQDYSLKPNDELYIQISSLDDASATIFTNSGNQNIGNLNAYGASLMSHTIDKDGYLELPVIGKILVKDKTVAQISTLIKESLVNVLSQPIVSVKLVNRYISVLGEVSNPGHFVYAQDKLSIFDALGLAGDITDYGNRKTVILIRNENGQNIRQELNLLDANLLASDFYFLRPNDIIYVKPMSNKFWGLRQFPFAIVLSSITTTILVLNYVKNN